MKLTDEELSRVLTAHAVGGLLRGGESTEGYPACLFQAAKLMWDCSGIAATELTGWFDKNYVPTWTVDDLLNHLRIRGLA